MIYLIIILVISNLFYILNYWVNKKLSIIFRHDLFNDLQMVDGYITLGKPEKAKDFLNNAYEKKDIYSILDKKNVTIKLGYLYLYNNIHNKTSNFNIFINKNISNDMFFSLSFVKTIFKAEKYLRTRLEGKITVEIEKDAVEVYADEDVKSFLYSA